MFSNDTSQDNSCAVDSREFRQKESAGTHITRVPGAYASVSAPKRFHIYWMTVTARRFCDQHEISSQIATGRSLPNDLEVMRDALTPLLTR